MGILALLLKLGFSLLIFMISLRLISYSVQAAIGRRLRRFLKILTYNPLISVISGAIVTAVLQSSSMVAALMVALVNAGELSLKQAFGVILGANIGTTITAQIITVNVSQLAMPILICGLFLLPWNKQCSSIGAVLVGFGGLFIGLESMRFSLLPLLEQPIIRQGLIDLSSNVYYGVLIGIVITAVVQSSSAVTSMVIVLARVNAISLLGAVAVALGSNIGTVATTIIAGIGMSKEARATAYADLLFNVLGVIIVLPVIYQFTYLISLTAASVPKQIANAHTLFNVVTAVFGLPLINTLSKVTRRWAGITE